MEYALPAGIGTMADLDSATLEDARGMLWTALEDPDPVLIFENSGLYNMEGVLPADAGVPSAAGQSGPASATTSCPLALRWLTSQRPTNPFAPVTRILTAGRAVRGEHTREVDVDDVDRRRQPNAPGVLTEDTAP